MRQGEWIGIGGIALAVLVGCSKSPSIAPSVPVTASTPIAAAPPESPERKLYEQVRSGHFEIDSALDPLETATKATRHLADAEDDKGTKAALLAVAKRISSAGTAIADFSAAPPEFEEFVKDLDAQDDDRLKAIAGCNRAISLLSQASGSLSDMLASDPPAQERDALTTARDAAHSASQTLLDAVSALGGKPE